MEKILALYKSEGETPLECLNRLRKENLSYKDAVLSYVGRLDPMAEGLLLVVIGEENKNREKYLHFEKTYEVDILFGIQTDTADILGLVKKVQEIDSLKISEVQPLKFWDSFVGKFSQPYPAYSSRTIRGKALFEWAREDRLREIEIPEKQVEINAISFLESYQMDSKKIFSSVKERVKKVKGDFRQDKIVESWKKNINEEQMFVITRIKVSCSSGTYMRSLSEMIGKKMGTAALAWKIKRTEIGPFSLAMGNFYNK